EIGIRMALGAAGSTIAAGVLLEAGALVIAGLAAGLGASWWLGRYIQEQLYGISPLDMPTIVLSSLTLAAVAAVAAFLPANRAARIAPMMALRNE
ncbi:MAG TPA: FtsX-like permease family protein, partial [Vicinamibacterales bacterium]|nr:FtsX-like permease family protein [Vicinamibacterales bacterium]